jgi:hypothetical protein
VARRSLKPQLNQIRTWVREGRTNAWIAHQLDVAPKDIETFTREHGLAPDDESGDGAGGDAVLDEERDMRAEDDALVAAELDAMDEQAAAAPEEPDEAEAGDAEGDDEDERRPRRRGRRGGRRRRTRGRRPLEGTFDHGEEGYGLWLDPAVQDDAVYAEHWAGHRPVTVAIETDRIVIRRRGDEGGDESSTESDDD